MLSLSLSSPLVLKSESWHCHRPAEHAWSCSLQDACEGWWVKQQLGRANTKVDARIRASSLPGSRHSSVRPPRGNQGAYIISFYRLTRHSSFTCLPNAAHILKRSLMAQKAATVATQSTFTWTQRERERDNQITTTYHRNRLAVLLFSYFDYIPVLTPRRIF